MLHENKDFNIRPNFPKHLDLEINSACNLSCVMCDRTNFNHGKMNIKDAKKIIKYFSENGCETIKPFWRGEATINPDLPEILKYSKEHGLKTMLNTNGAFTKCTPEDIEPYIDWISFSVDEYHKNNTAETRSAIYILANSDRNIYVEVQAGSLDVDLEIYCETIGIKYKLDGFTKRTDGTDYEYIKLGKNRKYCGFPDWRLIITHDLIAKPCCVCWGQNELNMFKVNIEKIENIKNAWNKVAYYNFRQDLKTNIFKSDICKNCPSRSAYV